MKELENEPGIDFENDCVSAGELELVTAKRRILEKLQLRFGESPRPTARNDMCLHAPAIS
jgi:hypothetical protein